MKLVVDTNVLFSFFKKESKTRRLILDCPIWAQEKAFKEQTKVKVLSTSDLISSLSLTRP